MDLPHEPGADDAGAQSIGHERPRTGRNRQGIVGMEATEPQLRPSRSVSSVEHCNQMLRLQQKSMPRPKVQ
jgi:hypothetical protein